MAKISSTLSDDLVNALKNADEVWIAVALMNINGCDKILNSIPNKCKSRFIVGIDLPTDPGSMSKLLLEKAKNRISLANVLIQTNIFFHPKVYIIRTSNKLKAFVGSANCTNGGFEKNIEMSIELDDQKVCNELIDWFNKLISQPLTEDFIADYKPKYQNRIKGKKREQKDIDSLKRMKIDEYKADFAFQQGFINQLRKFKNSPEYQIANKHRIKVIKEFKDDLNYPDFQHLDLDSFFNKKTLGTIFKMTTNKPIQQNRKKFTKLMLFIIDEKMPIDERINRALTDKELRIPYVKLALISKVLVIHDPKKYYLDNGASQKCFKYFGIKFPKKLNAGEKYKATRDKLKQLMNEAGIDNFAVLDSCLWNVQNEMEKESIQL